MDKSLSLHAYTSLAQQHPPHAQIIHPQDSETTKLCPNSRKILKKRSKYNKINDEIRLKLIEAVEKNGEMLKSAAKKFKVNYSSAKSIFQTYRKEGRVLRKTNKTRRLHRESSVPEKDLTPKLEEPTPVRHHSAPAPETDNNLPVLKPVQDYLSSPIKPASPLTDPRQLVGGFSSTVMRGLGEELRRFVAPSHLILQQLLMNETALVGQSKSETLLGLYPLLQAQLKPSLGQLFQTSLIQNMQYPYIKSLGEGMKLDALGLLMKQMIASGIPPS